MAGRPINQDRQLAKSLGFATYHGLTHRKCGTTERYTKSAGCVHCARKASTDGAEARSVLRTQRMQTALDKRDPVGQKEMVEDAANRFQQDIEDLM